MSYETEVMESLRIALRNTDGLKYTMKKFNENISTIERLATAIERQNELKEIELGLKEKTFTKKR